MLIAGGQSAVIVYFYGVIDLGTNYSSNASSLPAIGFTIDEGISATGMLEIWGDQGRPIDLHVKDAGDAQACCIIVRRCSRNNRFERNRLDLLGEEDKVVEYWNSDSYSFNSSLAELSVTHHERFLVHQLVSGRLFPDTDGFTQAKADFLAKHSSMFNPQKTENHSVPEQVDGVVNLHEATQADCLKNSCASDQELKTEFDQAAFTSLNEIPALASRSSLDFQTSFNPDTDPSYISARSLVENVCIPDTHLVIKIGHVRRHAGKQVSFDQIKRVV